MGDRESICLFASNSFKLLSVGSIHRIRDSYSLPTGPCSQESRAVVVVAAVVVVVGAVVREEVGVPAEACGRRGGRAQQDCRSIAKREWAPGVGRQSSGP